MVRVVLFILFIIVEYFGIYFSNVIGMNDYFTVAVVGFTAMIWYFVDRLARRAPVGGPPKQGHD